MDMIRASEDTIAQHGSTEVEVRQQCFPTELLSTCFPTRDTSIFPHQLDR